MQRRKEASRVSFTAQRGAGDSSLVVFSPPMFIRHPFLHLARMLRHPLAPLRCDVTTTASSPLLVSTRCRRVHGEEATGPPHASAGNRRNECVSRMRKRRDPQSRRAKLRVAMGSEARAPRLACEGGRLRSGGLAASLYRPSRDSSGGGRDRQGVASIPTRGCDRGVGAVHRADERRRWRLLR